MTVLKYRLCCMRRAELPIQIAQAKTVRLDFALPQSLVCVCIHTNKSVLYRAYKSRPCPQKRYDERISSSAEEARKVFVWNISAANTEAQPSPFVCIESRLAVL